MEAIEKFLRELVYSIDRILYVWVDKIYNFIIELAGYAPKIFDPKVINSFTQDIYTLMTIYLVFKIAFILLKAIANPEEMEDKNKGGMALVKRIVVMLILVIVVPLIFDFSRKVQESVLKQKVIESFLLGGLTNEEQKNYEYGGGSMAYYVFRPFIEKNPSADSYGCTESFEAFDAFAGGGDYWQNINVFSSRISQRSSDEFCLNHSYLLSTAILIITLLFLIITTVDVSLRMIKLVFLQIISPLVISTYIDEKSSKDGVFKKWIKVCIGTYADLFIRVVGLAFLAFILVALENADWADDENSFMVKLLIVLGGLMFTKSAPKLIEDLTGIKLGGSFTLNPLRKLREIPVAGTLSAGAIGLTSGGISGFMRNGVAGILPGAALGAKAGMENVPMHGMDAGKSQLKRGSWGSGADAIARAYTGDKNAQGGIMNALSNRMSQSVNEDMYEKTIAVKKAESAVTTQEQQLSQAIDHKNEIEMKFRQAKIEKDAILQGRSFGALSSDEKYRFNELQSIQGQWRAELATAMDKVGYDYDSTTFEVHRDANGDEILKAGVRGEAQILGELKDKREKARATVRDAKRRYVSTKE